MSTESAINWTRAALGWLGGVLISFVGGYNPVLLTLIVLVFVDFWLGVIHAAHEGQLKSRECRRGIIRKVMIFVIVGIANLIEQSILPGGVVLKTAVILFYIAGEAMSVLEHCAYFGLPLPKVLRTAIQSIKHKADEDEEGGSNGKKTL